jgi:hypothetical protein
VALENWMTGWTTMLKSSKRTKRPKKKREKPNKKSKEAHHKLDVNIEALLFFFLFPLKKNPTITPTKVVFYIATLLEDVKLNFGKT